MFRAPLKHHQGAYNFIKQLFNILDSSSFATCSKQKCLATVYTIIRLGSKHVGVNVL